MKHVCCAKASAADGAGVSAAPASSPHLQVCDKCRQRTRSTKKLTIQRFPRILVLRILSPSPGSCRREARPEPVKKAKPRPVPLPWGPWALEVAVPAPRPQHTPLQLGHLCVVVCLLARTVMIISIVSAIGVHGALRPKRRRGDPALGAYSLIHSAKGNNNHAVLHKPSIRWPSPPLPSPSAPFICQTKCRTGRKLSLPPQQKHQLSSFALWLCLEASQGLGLFSSRVPTIAPGSLTSCAPDLNRFSTTRYSIKKCSVFVDFPLQQLNLKEFASEKAGESVAAVPSWGSPERRGLSL